MIKIYTNTIDYLSDKNEYEICYKKASLYRKAKIDGLKPIEEKKRSLAAEMILMEALDDIGIDYDGEILVGKYGKPSLMSHPEVFYSLAHSGNRVMCVISDMPVGCDVERQDRCTDQVARRFFSDIEIEKIETIKESSRRKYVCTALWSLKESFGKMIGEGVTLLMDKVSFDINAEENVVEGINVHYDQLKEVFSYKVWEDDGYWYSYCVKSLWDTD